MYKSCWPHDHRSIYGECWVLPIEKEMSTVSLSRSGLAGFRSGLSLPLPNICRHGPKVQGFEKVPLDLFTKLTNGFLLISGSRHHQLWLHFLLTFYWIDCIPILCISACLFFWILSYSVWSILGTILSMWEILVKVLLDGSFKQGKMSY